MVPTAEATANSHDARDTDTATAALIAAARIAVTMQASTAETAPCRLPHASAATNGMTAQTIHPARTQLVLVFFISLAVLLSAEPGEPDVYGRVPEGLSGGEVFLYSLAFGAFYGAIPGALLGLVVHWVKRRNNSTPGWTAPPMNGAPPMVRPPMVRPPMVRPPMGPPPNGFGMQPPPPNQGPSGPGWTPRR